MNLKSDGRKTEISTIYQMFVTWADMKKQNKKSKDKWVWLFTVKSTQTWHDKSKKLSCVIGVGSIPSLSHVVFTF